MVGICCRRCTLLVIWASDRASKSEAFGEPQNLDAPVNTAANDFCPTPIYGSYLMFVPEGPGPHTCSAGPGLGDIYIIRRNAAFGWGEPGTSVASRTGRARTAQARSSVRRSWTPGKARTSTSPAP